MTSYLYVKSSNPSKMNSPTKKNKTPSSYYYSSQNKSDLEYKKLSNNANLALTQQSLRKKEEKSWEQQSNTDSQDFQEEGSGLRVLSKKIYFCWNSPSLSDLSLESSFSKFGKVVHLYTVKDHRDPLFKYGFLIFETIESSIRVVKMRKVMVDGISVRVRTVKERNPRKAKNLRQSTRNLEINYDFKFENNLCANKPVIRQYRRKVLGNKEIICQKNHLNAPKPASKPSFKKNGIRKVEERHLIRNDLLQLNYPVHLRERMGSCGYYIITGSKTQHSFNNSTILNVGVSSSRWSLMN